MNICPRCEAEMEEGLELCPGCVDHERPQEASVGTHPEEGALDVSSDLPSASLELEDGYRFDLHGEEMLLGRRDPLEEVDPEIDLSFHGGFEGGVSRRHAVIRREKDTYLLEDLGSTNGTVLNREKVPAGRSMVLAEGDVIHFGHLRVVFHGGLDDGSATGGVS